MIKVGQIYKTKGKNEQQKDLHITNDTLTEQWKKGKLPEGDYFVSSGTKVTTDYYYLSNYWERHFDREIYEVLAPVPDYNEWRNMVNCACEEHEANTKLLEQNAQLKELLAIAVEALDKVATYMTCDENEIREIYPDFCADQAALDTVNEAMDKIKELEK